MVINRRRVSPGWATIVVASMLACGSRKEAATDDGRAPPVSATKELEPLIPLALGKEDLASYTYNRKRAARGPFKEVLAAEEAGDWPAAEAACRRTLLVEPGHLEAHWHLASALARQKRYAEVVDSLSTAVAGDWMRWGERSLIARATVGFNASNEGPRWARLVDHYRDEFRRTVADALLVVGRRGKPWYPSGEGKGNLNHRSEIYAYDLDAGRYLRVSRTNGSLVGFVRSHATREVAYLSYRKVWSAGDDTAPAYIREVKVGTIDLDAVKMSHREASFADVAWIELFYGDGDKPLLHARVRSAHPRRGERLVTTYVIDAERGRAKVVGDIAGSHEFLRVAYDSAMMRRPEVGNVAADWGSDGSAGAFRLDNTRKIITMPSGESAARDSMQWSPNRRRLAVATKAVDECSQSRDERVTRLYVAEAATGKLRAVAAGEGGFAAVWLDDTRLAYVDRGRAGSIVRLVDVTSGAEVARLEAVGGIGTDWLPLDPECAPEGGEFDDDDDFFEEEESVSDAKSEPAKKSKSEPAKKSKSKSK